MSSNNVITKNCILRSLPANEAVDLAHGLTPYEMPHGAVIFEAEDIIKHLYFPSDAMISAVATTADGQMAETAVIGWEGVGGVEALLGQQTSLTRHVIQLAGDGHRIELGVAQRHFERGGEFQKLVHSFLRAMMLAMSQTALCNRIHVAEKRLAKWLLMCHDRATSDTMKVTHEFAGYMLGSNRVSVTQAFKVLHEHGLTNGGRGKMTIVDREALEKFSCECYARMREEFDRLTGNGRRRLD